MEWFYFPLFGMGCCVGIGDVEGGRIELNVLDLLVVAEWVDELVVWSVG